MSTLTKGIILNAEVESLSAGGRATPQSNEARELGRDRMAFGPEGAGSFGRDRFAGGETSSAPDRKLLIEGQVPNAGPSDGPVLGATQFNDDYRGGVGGGGIQDRNAGPPSNAGIQDGNAGGMDHGGIEDRNAGGVSRAGIQDRNAGGIVSIGIQDRMQGGGSADAYTDRYQAAAGGPTAEDRYEGMERGDFERDQLDLPEDVQGFTTHRKGVPRKPRNIDEPLRQVPNPVYENVDLLRNIAGLSKRITAIQATTANIKKQLPPALWTTAPNELPIKVSSRLKGKLPK